MNGQRIGHPAPRLRKTGRAAALLALALLAGCGKRAWTPTLFPPSQYRQLDEGADYLKVHMRNGDLYVLSTWQFHERGSVFTGRGNRYDIARAELGTSDHYSIPLDSVVLLEANESRTIQTFGISWLGFWTTVSGVVTGICVSDPKACFGSCPTFYVYDGEREKLAAEGFSSSVAKVLEERDVDALYFARPRGRQLEIRMTNEALETHAVRRIRLHAVPRSDTTRVFATPDGRYHAVLAVTEPSGCRAPEGDCREPLRALDAFERTSVTDSTNLAVREDLFLDFPRQDGPLGLVLSARNTFVTTYLIYQSMAYMGSRAGELLAQLERGDPALKSGAQRLLRTLGGIEIAVLQPDGSWQQVGEYYENGPIAADVQFFNFQAPDSDGPIRLRLRMAKGSWRIGYAALAGPTAPVEPLLLEPAMVTKRGLRDADAREALADRNRYLFTYPGDEYRIVFALPADDEPYEFFLESQGYYYEWMRSEWLAEEDPVMLALLLTNPDAALRRLAPAFKMVEPQMESLFWSSKFGWR